MTRRLVQVAALFVLVSLTTACTVSTNPLAGVPREVQAAAASKVSVVPSPVSTLEFKELGETKRFAVLRQLIRTTWGDECEPVFAATRLYSPRGDSLWHVRCAGRNLSADYSVSLPERRATGARVLQCFAGAPGRTVCSIVGKPT